VKSTPTIACPACSRSLDPKLYNSYSAYEECNGCGAKITVRAFPALYRIQEAGTVGEQAQLDDAACFYHADKKAERLCDSCGRFLCKLCALPLGDEVLCASCLENRRKKPDVHAFKARQMRYDKLAIGMAILPMLYFFLTFLTAPATFFIVLFFWKKKPAFAPGYKPRMVLALIIALLQIFGWIIGITAIIKGA
jgi:hypothetical protein